MAFFFFFLNKITPLSSHQYWSDTQWPETFSGPRYTVRLENRWYPDPAPERTEPWADPYPALVGDLTLSLEYEDGSTNGSRNEHPDGVLRHEEADALVLDLVNRLTEALEETDWVLTKGRKVTETFQGFEADEPEE